VEAYFAKMDAFTYIDYARQSVDDAIAAAELEPLSDNTAYLEREALIAESEAEHATELATEADPQGFPKALASHLKRRSRYPATDRILKRWVGETDDIDDGLVRPIFEYWTPSS